MDTGCKFNDSVSKPLFDEGTHFTLVFHYLFEHVTKEDTATNRDNKCILDFSLCFKTCEKMNILRFDQYNNMDKETLYLSKLIQIHQLLRVR